jgi:hypothetical protein
MIVGGLLARALPFLIVGAVAAVPAYMAGNNIGYASAMKEERSERTRAWVREVGWMSLVADTNQSKRELISDVEGWMKATGKARQIAANQIANEKQKAEQAEAQAERRITELLNEIESSDWAGTPVDPRIVCRMRNTDDCGNTSRRANADDAMGVRE